MTKNRLLILVGVLLIIFIGLSVYIFAILMPNAGQAGLTDLTPTPSATVVTQTQAKLRRVIGTIQSLSSQSLVITLTRNKKTLTVNVTARTKYSTTTGTASFNDLKVGQTVNVLGRSTLQDTSVITATSIAVKTTP
jgi:uncharacterized protein DUF5666